MGISIFNWLSQQSFLFSIVFFGCHMIVKDKKNAIHFPFSGKLIINQIDCIYPSAC